jgi:hypothetical protein
MLVNIIQPRENKSKIGIKSQKNSNINKSFTIFKELSPSAIHSHLFWKASVEEMVSLNFQRF